MVVRWYVMEVEVVEATLMGVCCQARILYPRFAAFVVLCSSPSRFQPAAATALHFHKDNHLHIRSMAPDNDYDGW